MSPTLPPEGVPAEGSVPPEGLVLVDKPQGWTSHDVVGRLRRLAGTKKVGHGGTLDPMATGVLVCGVGRATRLLGQIAGADKTYEATIRLGISTNTEDADGQIDAWGGNVDRALQDDELATAIASLRGVIWQRPSSVSAIKVDGKRAYKRVRDGEQVELAKRQVTISAFDLIARRRELTVVPAGEEQRVVDVDVSVTCSTGTYIRALARDLGEALGTYGHLTALRRTRVGGFAIEQASTLDELEANLQVVPLAQAAGDLFETYVVDAPGEAEIGFGRRLDWPVELDPTGTIAVFNTEGDVLCLAQRKDDRLAPVVVWV